jgi:hypothetical protein
MENLDKQLELFQCVDDQFSGSVRMKNCQAFISRHVHGLDGGQWRLILMVQSRDAQEECLREIRHRLYCCNLWAAFGCTRGTFGQRQGKYEMDSINSAVDKAT